MVVHFSRQHGRSETEEYSSESESESEDEEELQIILEDLQRQNEELEVKLHSCVICIHWLFYGTEFEEVFNLHLAVLVSKCMAGLCTFAEQA